MYYWLHVDINRARNIFFLICYKMMQKNKIENKNETIYFILLTTT